MTDTRIGRGSSRDAPSSEVRKIPIVRKLAVSIAIGTIAYFLTNILIGNIGEQQIWVITLSLLLGGVVFLVQFMVTVEQQMNDVERAELMHSTEVEKLVDRRLSEMRQEITQGFAEIDKVVQSGFTKINEATELFGLVEASALRTDAVTQLVRHSTQIDPSMPPLVFRFAQDEIGRMSEFLKELSEGGDVSYEGEDRDWMLSLTRNCQSTIDATSLTTVDAGVDGGLWTSDLGQRYMEIQRSAITRGVRIRRVFIMDGPSAGDSGFVQVCQMQRDMGIEVRILDSTAIPEVRRSSLFDFILFDDSISYEHTGVEHRRFRAPVYRQHPARTALGAREEPDRTVQGPVERGGRGQPVIQVVKVESIRWVASRGSRMPSASARRWASSARSGSTSTWLRIVRTACSVSGEPARAEHGDATGRR